MKLEKWKDVIGFVGFYQVSNLGRIKSTYRGGKILTGNVDSRGYNRLWLWKNKVKSKHSIHKLVALAFIPNPKNLPFLNHLDGIKTNNRSSNLEWCSAQENTKHAFRIGLMRGSSEPRPYMRRPVQQVSPFLKTNWDGASTASKITGISITAIANCLQGRSKHPKEMLLGFFLWSRGLKVRR